MKVQTGTKSIRGHLLSKVLVFLADTFVMEQVAIIADIHGNLPALKSVVHEIAARKITRIWCLGDTMDWFEEDDITCMRWCLEYCETTLRGNHEADITDDEKFLARLPIRHIQTNTGAWHGSPYNPLNDYVHDRESADRAITTAQKEFPDIRLITVGHVHIPSAYSLGNTYYTRAKHGETLLLNEPTIACPGSVGQGHDDGVAEWMFVDFDSQNNPVRVTWQNIRYRDPKPPTSLTIQA